MHPQYAALLGLLGLVLFCGGSLNAEQASSRFVDVNPLSLILINNTFYYIEASAPKNWFNALSACQKIGYELVSLQTEEKYDEVNDFLISSGQPAYFWTSGNDLYTLGKHHWYPGNETILDSIWAANQPDNAAGVEHCDALAKLSKNYTLRDYNCNLIKNYICELPFPSASSPSSPAGNSTSNEGSSSAGDSESSKD